MVIRTLPNDADKRTAPIPGRRAPRRTSCPTPCTGSSNAASTSLVVDLPSLDRADDGGRLAAHREYWGLPPGADDAAQAARGQALVTELAFVPDAVPDGLYLLDLQVPAFGADAAPSRPVLYPLQSLRWRRAMRLDREHAHALDAADPLAAWRDRFVLPREPASGRELVYLCGHSLGAQPVLAADYVEEVMRDWRSLARRGPLHRPPSVDDVPRAAGAGTGRRSSAPSRPKSSR